jgi:endonuclease-8
MEAPGWVAVCFSAPVVETYLAADQRRHPGLGSLGPDLCVEGVDLDECVARMGRLVDPATTLDEVLLDQRICCGVGNVYKSEVLWACAVHPFTPLGAIGLDLRHELVETAARQLQANIHRADRSTMAGGGLAVYGRTGKPCRRCATPIEVHRHGEQARVTYWCPECQELFHVPAPPEEALQDTDGLEGAEPLEPPSDAAAEAIVGAERPPRPQPRVIDPPPPFVDPLLAREESGGE